MFGLVFANFGGFQEIVDHEKEILDVIHVIPDVIHMIRMSFT